MGAGCGVVAIGAEAAGCGAAGGGAGTNVAGGGVDDVVVGTTDCAGCGVTEVLVVGCTRTVDVRAVRVVVVDVDAVSLPHPASPTPAEAIRTAMIDIRGDTAMVCLFSEGSRDPVPARAGHSPDRSRRASSIVRRDPTITQSAWSTMQLTFAPRLADCADTRPPSITMPLNAIRARSARRLRRLPDRAVLAALSPSRRSTVRGVAATHTRLT